MYKYYADAIDYVYVIEKETIFNKSHIVMITRPGLLIRVRVRVRVFYSYIRIHANRITERYGVRIRKSW